MTIRCSKEITKTKISRISNSKSNLRVSAAARAKLTLKQDVRRSRVIGLHSKGLTQMEIARQLGVNQSTISDDMRYIRQKANKNIVDVGDNLSFEFLKYLASTDEISRELWEISEFHIDPNNTDANYIMNINLSTKTR